MSSKGNKSHILFDSDESDEEPIPKRKSSSKATKQSQSSSSSSKQRKSSKKEVIVVSDDDDEEEPIPKSKKKVEVPKRKSKVLSDSSDEDFEDKKPKSQKGTSSGAGPSTKVPRQEKDKKGDLKAKVKSLQPVSAAAVFGLAPIFKKAIKEKESKVKEEASGIKTNGNEVDREVKPERRSPRKSEPVSPDKSRSSSRSSNYATPEKREATSRKSASPKQPQPELKPTPNVPAASTSKSSSPDAKMSKEKEKTNFKKPTAPVTTPNRSSSSGSKKAEPPSKSTTPKKGSTSSMKTPEKPAKGSEDSGPELTPEEKKRKQQSAYFKHLSRGGPKNLGSKEVPIGAPDCLKGLTFVLTGVLDSLERDDVVEIVGKYGGRVTSAVSGKTTHLIVGDEPGESKIKKAQTLKIPRISEDDLLEMIRKSNPNQPKSQTMFGVTSDEEEEADDVIATLELPADPAQLASPGRDSGVGSSESQSTITPSPSKQPKISRREEMKAKPVVAAQAPVPEPKAKARTTVTSAAAAAPPSLMWVDKYKPTSLKNVVGQGGDKSNAQKLTKWLQNWFQYHGKAGEKAKASWPGMKDPEGKMSKAALLSGAPGIGKTSTAHLACKQVGYDYFEMNASDTRNKRGLHEIAADALTSKSIWKTGAQNELTSKHVLIMDEVDGMSGNEDRGGIQELINLIKTSRVPVICICNDRNHQKIRSLANYCFDLRFNKPNNEQLKGLIQSICFKEKIKLPIESAQQLINSSDHDIRQILNQLELFKESKSSESICNPRKDLKFGPWDVCRKVFSASEHRGMSIHDKNNLFFQDYSFGPLFVQENYVKWTPIKAKGNKYKTLDRIKLAAEAIATGDLVDNLIRRSNNWSLMPTQAVFSSILPGEYMEGNEVSGIEFPRWLGKNSNRGKMSRLLQQLHTHVHLEVSGSLEALNMDYLPYLRRSVVNPLAAGDVGTAIGKMQTYSLMREDLDNINELALWPGMRNPLEKLDSKTKAAFTRQLNKELIVPYSVVKITKGRGKGVVAGAEDAEGLEDEEINEEEEEEDEKIESDAMIKIRKTSKSSSSAASSSKASKPKNKKAVIESDDEEDDDEPKPSTSKKGNGSKRKNTQGESSSSSKRARK